ncbi:patatin-like phospholipase family protein [Salinifilum ghardaiensis]
MGSPQLLKHSLRHPRQSSPLRMLAALCPCGTSPFYPVRAFLGEVLPDGAWPAGNHVLATDYDTGERTLFSGTDGVDVLDAVAASCAVPGCFPPVPIGEHRYVDGSVASVTGADLLVHCDLDEVYVLAPMAARSFDTPRSMLTWLERGVRAVFNQVLQREVNTLRRCGTQVTVLRPCAQDLTAMGWNPMDPARSLRVLDTAQETAVHALRDT